MISHDLSSTSVVTNHDSFSLDNSQVTKNYEEKPKSQGEHDPDNVATLSTALMPSDDTAPDEDVIVEENITPFYMTSGKRGSLRSIASSTTFSLDSDQSFHQTLQQLGIDVRDTPMFNPTFQH